jgi:hypothetical protein
MNTFKTRKLIWIVPLILILLVLAAGYRFYEGDRPAPIPFKKQLYEGVLTGAWCIMRRTL